MVSSVAGSKPPTITIANGRCVSDPMLCDSAAGSRPIDAGSAVIRTGRSRPATARSTVSGVASGFARARRM